MNIQEGDIMNMLLEEPYINQRILAEKTNHSLGIVNRSIKELMKNGYIDEEIKPTSKAMKEIRLKMPKRAIILAAGYGMRMVPINTEVPKGLLEVHGEKLIERTIRQLHEVGITEIYIIVGFMKEKYEYLIDEYGAELIVNAEYAIKNNLHSVNLVRHILSNAYIIPCDIWCDYNPYHRCEMYSWYMVSDLVDDDSVVRVNRKMELVCISGSVGGNAMVGISYLLPEEAEIVCGRMKELCEDTRYHKSFWEEALYCNGKMIVAAKVVHSENVAEINTYEQLRELDCNSHQLESDAIKVIREVFQVSAEQILNLTVLKKGMTNHSFIFTVDGKRYIMRIPGEGTNKLIARRQEAAVYQAIRGKDICDEIVYINPENGYKITEFLEGARVCNPEKMEDVEKCMKYLRAFHEMKLKVDHEFHLFEQIEFYETLWGGRASVWSDYQKTKQKVFSLKDYIDSHVSEKILSHIDAVCDNFLFFERDGKEEICLIDWEYAGMQDPHVDVAMFCIYALYNRKQVDRAIDAYFPEGCSDENRIKIYCYISACGLLWSNWCEYKSVLGIEFGEYSLRQYRYAKEYYKIAEEMMDEKYKG